MIFVVDHQQLFDSPLMQDAPRFRLARPNRHGREIFASHQLADLLARILGEAHIAVGEDAAELA